MTYAPRKGSLGFSFRRAKEIIVRGTENSIWAHKVGMVHEGTKYLPRTILELPPTEIKCYRIYKDKKVLKEVLTYEELEPYLNNEHSIRTVLEIAPRFRKNKVYRETSFFKSINEIYEKLNNQTIVKIKGTTKGKGFSGVIKRRGIKLGKRKRARANKERHIGCLGSRTGHVTWRAPQAGHLGTEHRTYKSYIVAKNEVSEKPFEHYGFVKHSTISINGSIVGNPKSLVRISWS
jgi:ribosomal protein L3